MIAEFSITDKVFKADLSKPIDISLPLGDVPEAVRAWYVPPVKIEPVVTENWVGDVNQGGTVNFRNVWFNPHGHGTHTECVGHISKEPYTIHQCLKTFMFPAQLVTVQPELQLNGDRLMHKDLFPVLPIRNGVKALIIRTLPNGTFEKLGVDYSNTNPPYLTSEAVAYFVSKGIDHILIDLPSVDREIDDGILAAHHAFWEYPENTATHRTITEMIYVPEDIKDGYYLLNLQIASFENDASPSKPVLYKAY